jgi:hypothetical protein
MVGDVLADVHNNQICRSAEQQSMAVTNDFRQQTRSSSIGRRFVVLLQPAFSIKFFRLLTFSLYALTNWIVFRTIKNG